MWTHLTAKNLIGLQRKAKLRAMGEKARELQREGYMVDADRILDEMLERRRQWEKG